MEDPWVSLGRGISTDFVGRVLAGGDGSRNDQMNKGETERVHAEIWNQWVFMVLCGQSSN